MEDFTPRWHVILWASRSGWRRFRKTLFPSQAEATAAVQAISKDLNRDLVFRAVPLEEA